ncbi:MAG: nucleotidyl transferase AbiEii/AbiGii toxin family protein [Chloroflexi bacterium]|nr:nucleotidyl transferase AbiEii/AbiGii toxin family protein [Chloroflexota bacterium]
MFGTGSLTFQEFMMSESLPLATLQEAILDFLRGRDDAVIFGAQAVNAYVPEPRMSQDIDLLSTRAAELAEELRAHLSGRFHIAVRVREVSDGRGYKLYQIQKPANRHLADIRLVDALPPFRRIAEVLVASPEELIALKVIAYYQRRGQPKSGTDWRDVAMLLLSFPELKTENGAVAERLRAEHAGDDVMNLWAELVRQEIQPEDDDY